MDGLACGGPPPFGADYSNYDGDRMNTMRDEAVGGALERAEAEMDIDSKNGTGSGKVGDNDGDVKNEGANEETKSSIVNDFANGATTVMTAINTCCNPLYLVVDGAVGLATDKNLLGEPVDWTESTANIISSIPISKLGAITYGITEGAVGAANRILAAKYLAKHKQLDNFVGGSARFELQLGTKNYVYHETIGDAARTRWSTPTRFGNSTDAWNRLGLGYPGSQNNASNIFGTRNFGLFINGTAAPKGNSIGYGIQNFKSFGFSTYPKFKKW